MVKKTGKKSKDSPGSRPSTPSNEPPSAGYLISCDIPTKNFICYLNDLKSVDKRFILEDLDATHLLIKDEARDEIMDEVEKWQNSNVWSGSWTRSRHFGDPLPDLPFSHPMFFISSKTAVETVGENLDMS